jgi:hypothetical protein
LTNTSSCANESPARLSSTASSSASGGRRSPCDALRRAEARLRGERLHLDEQRPRALQQQVTALPDAGDRAIAEEELEGFSTASSPAPSCGTRRSRPPLPKRFFVARNTR